jgi:SAM-dependent methyltransferase
LNETSSQREVERTAGELHRVEQVREPWLRTGRMLELIGQAAKGRILLVGEGEGLLAKRLECGERGRVTWLEPAFQASGKVVELPGSDGAVRIIADCYNTPFEAEDFDAVAAQFTLDYVKEPRRALIEWARVLRTGGTIALVTRNRLFRGPDFRPRPRPEQSFSPDELRNLVADCGFEVRELSTLIPYLRLPRFYRGDLSFSYRFERLPMFRYRGMLLFVSAVKRPGGTSIVNQGRA